MVGIGGGASTALSPLFAAAAAAEADVARPFDSSESCELAKCPGPYTFSRSIFSRARKYIEISGWNPYVGSAGSRWSVSDVCERWLCDVGGELSGDVGGELDGLNSFFL